MPRLYSLIVKPSVSTPFVPPPNGEMWYLRHAALSCGGSLNDYATLLYKAKDGEQWTVLGTLRPDRTDYMTLDLPLSEYVEFQVKGTGEVHLTGSLVAEDDSPLFDTDDEQEAEEEMMQAVMNGGQNVNQDDADDDSDENSEEEPELIPVDALLKKEIKEKGKKETVVEKQEETVAEKEKKGEETTGLSKSAAKRLRKKQKRDAKATGGSEETERNPKQHKVTSTPVANLTPESPSKTPLTSKVSDPKRKRIRRFSNGFIIENLSYGPEEGSAVTQGKKIAIKYEGKLKNGTVFDKTRGDTTFEFTYGKGEVVKGLDKGLDDMRIGDKRRLTVPSKMGYGVQGALPAIPPNSDLCFDIELIKIID